MARVVQITDDIDGTPAAEEVIFSWDGITWSVDLSDANKAKLQDALQPYLDVAHPAQVASTDPPRAPRAARSTPQADKIDYSDPSYAGSPHRGKVSPAEAEFVSSNLDLVNQRLKAEGLREIDPLDQKMKDRYQL